MQKSLDYKTIAIVGSRRRTSPADFDKLKDIFFSIYKNGDRIVSGGCPKGGDRFAELIAKAYQIPIMIYYAQWNKLGKSAGFARNTNIAEDADIIIALVTEDRKGGTEDTIRKAEKMGKEIVLVTPVEFEPISAEDIANFDPLKEEE